MTLRTRLLRAAVGPALAAWLILLPGPVPAQLPTLGDTSDLDSIAERKLGERVARELYRDPDYLDDPLLDDYVLGLWTRLLAAARLRGELSAELDDRFAWRVLLGRDRTVNAFALPGGWLGLHLGLLAATTSRDELASVLAHELSHVTQRHISRLMTQQNRQLPWMMAGLLLGALVANRSPDAANAVIAGTQALGAQGQLNFSRDMEREADRVGYGVAQQAGFEPQGFVTMFEKLQQAARLNDTGAFPYLRTHPMTTERMADMQQRHQLEGRTVPAPLADVEHGLMAARSRVLMNSGVDALRSLLVEPDSGAFASLAPSRQMASVYAAALAAARLRDSAGAARLSARLTALAAADPVALRYARLLAVEVALLAQDHAQAARLADAGAPGRPDMLLWAQAQTRSGGAAAVAQRLQTWVALHPRDAGVWEALSQAYAAQGLALRAIRADAEAHAARLDYAGARDRLRAAQDLVRRSGGVDHIDASIIDTRARQLDSALREQALER